VRGVTLGRSECGRSEVVVLVREVLWVTAVRLARCGEGNGRARHKSRPQRGGCVGERGVVGNGRLSCKLC
jgi:hypothetical protein